MRLAEPLLVLLPSAVLEGPVDEVLVPVEETPLWPEEEGLVPLAVGRAA